MQNTYRFCLSWSSSPWALLVMALIVATVVGMHGPLVVTAMVLVIMVLVMAFVAVVLASPPPRKPSFLAPGRPRPRPPPSHLRNLPQQCPRRAAATAATLSPKLLMDCGER